MACNYVFPVVERRKSQKPAFPGEEVRSQKPTGVVQVEVRMVSLYKDLGA